MYGHELISSLNEEFFDPARAESDFYIDKIKNSVHFFMGEISDVLDVANLSRYGVKYAFQGVLSQDVRMPYPLMALFMGHSVKPNIAKKLSQNGDGLYTKTALILEERETGDGFSLLQVCYVPSIGMWLPSYFELNFYFSDIIDKSNPEDRAKVTLRNVRPTVDMTEFANDTGNIGALANACLMLLNTKNIISAKKAAPAWINKKRAKKGKPPLFSYHTLRLKLPGKQKKGAGGIGRGNTTRLHLCRGHFKTYTEENPLLGKHTGRYWWQPQARGNKRRGVVMKDYAVTVQ